MIDCVIIPLFIEKKLSKRIHFDQISKGSYQLSAQGKAIVVESVMKNFAKNDTWRGKQYSLKSIVENQIKSIGRHFSGKEKNYTPYHVDRILP
jgi:hypothetical protein